jgi:anti-sigma regulatory factor (Ser/Thr protein kinase)
MGDAFFHSMRNQLAELPRLLDAVAAFLRSGNISSETAFKVQLILDELISNVIRWGYRDDRSHTLRITITVEPAELCAVIEDDAEAFDPTEFSSPDIQAKAEDRSEGGLGIHLVRNLADLTYRRIGDQNRVELRIKLD